jgi:simple sugar transport system substrate-binding protein
MVSYDNFAADSCQIIRTAISQKPRASLIPDWVYEAEDPAIKDAIAAGIKVILMNAGLGQGQGTGRPQLCRVR